ncbi:hypothetical protein ABT390_36730 [Streptomyces aurantiacus]|uniref:Uncharacterized protein n=1 Tax=Streptomyces aurantiacus JA 4570 TaxID=1286094 RepID=S3ZE00_9ACTN|nr:hypothetical protein [Streptomyces aurantiacus]EPH40879.1 hypothetical protein STRAU_6094 [Streptomyces aurantiacus JA 4570]
MKIYADRLLAETVPDGTFGGARPPRGQRKARRGPDPEAARHRAELAAELSAVAVRRKNARATANTPQDPATRTAA